MAVDQEQTPEAGMSDNANTPDTGTGTQEQPTSENWEQRYKDAQAWGTRNAQRAAELEAETALVARLRSEDPNEQREALRALGYEVPDDDTQYSDPNEQLARELAELKAWRDEFTGQQQQEQYVAQIEASVEQQLDQLGNLSDPQKDWIVSRAIALPPTQEGLPDIPAAHAEFQALINAEKQAWAGTKPRSAFTTAAGQQASQVPDLDKHEKRVDYMLSRLQAEAQ